MYFEQLRCGMTVEIPPAVMDKQEMLSFAQRYDNVPLHTDEAYAAQTPFGGCIAPGILSYLLVWSNYLKHDLFQQALLAGTSVRIDWHKPVYAGDTLTGRAKITRLTRRSAKNGAAELTCYAYNQHGELVLTAVHEVIVRCTPQVP